MDEKKLIKSKLMVIHSEYEQIMASQNPYKYGADGWIEWQMEQSRKRRENYAASVALSNELFKGEGKIPTKEQLDRMLAPARKRMAEEREKIEQFKKQHFSENDFFLLYVI